MNDSISRRDSLKTLGSAAAAAALGPWVHSAQAQALPAITFGGTMPFSGRWAEIGTSMHTSFLTYAKYVNEVLGGLQVGNRKYRLDVKMVDDASDPQRATALLQRQIDDGVQLFLGSYSSPTVLPQVAIIERARRPMVQAGGGADAIFTQGYKFAFGIYPRASRSAFPAVDAMEALKPKPKTFSVAYANNPFSKPQGIGVIERLKAKGFEVYETFELPAQVQDVSAMVASIRAKTPDVVMCLTADQDSLLIARQMAQARADVKMLFVSLGPQTATFRESLGKYAEGLTCISTWSPEFKFKDPFFGTTEKFVEYYKANNTLPIIYHQGTAGACMTAYCWALQQAGKVDDGMAVRDALARIDIESLYGRIKFTPEGDGDPVLMGSAVTQVQGKDVKVIFPSNVKSAEPIWPVQPWSQR